MRRLLLQTACTHEGLDFSDFCEPVDDHGFGWLERSSLLGRALVFQGIIISLFVHAAVISIFAFAPRSAVSERSPWLEVSLVSLGSGEVTEAAGGKGSGGAAGPTGEGESGRPPASNTVLIDSAAPEADPASAATPDLSLAPQVPKATAEKTSTQPRPASRPKDLAKNTPNQNKASKIDAISPPPSQSAHPLVESAGESGSASGMSESEGTRSGSGDGSPGRGMGGSSTGGPVDSEFNSANGPRFATKIMPKYPHLARQLGKEAVVVLRVTIDESGRPIAVEALKPAGSGFDEEAIRAVKNSLFHPAKREGKPVICRAILPIRFELKDSE
jgi:periplasmic protein TonB